MARRGLTIERDHEMPIPTPIQAFIDHQADTTPGRYDDLRAVIFNGTLKRSPEPSHTDGLLAVVLNIFRRTGVEFVEVRTVDHVIPPGVWPDMRAHGYETDDFPAIYHDAVKPADIILVAGPIWLGDQSSQTRKIIERLYAYSGEVNSSGQWSYYGKVGGALTTGNEDGGKHVSAQILYALQHIGLTIPPQSDAYWNGEAGPGPSYLDRDSGGQENAWTLRNTVFMTWNVLHLARMLKDAGGVPAYGNSTRDWDLSEPTHPNPEYR
jgi:multimeric flavodoxin WrbA